MTPDKLAELHARCFETPRPWSEVEFRKLLTVPGVFLETAEHGFALGRCAGAEAELLTLAVAPDHRRRGIAQALVARFEETALAQDATEALLEVAADNAAAQALYARAGFAEAGRRPAYYQRPDGRRIDALILRKALQAA